MCKSGYVVSLFVFCIVVHTSTELKILGIFPHAGKSHFDVFEPLIKSLAAKGHELIVVSHFPQKNPLPRYKDINVRQENVYVNFITVDMIPSGWFKHFRNLFMIEKMADEACAILQNKQMKELSDSNEKFDLAIIEMFNSDCFLGFIHKFNIPFIGLSSCTSMPWTNLRFANSILPSYVPNIFAPFSGDTLKMSFLQRVENTLLHLFTSMYYDYVIVETANIETRKLFGDIPHIRDIAKNASLLLVNTHFSLNHPKPLVPNVIEIGGMFLPAHNSIPANLEKWINESTNGVIYFSMGSMIKGHSFPVETRKAFLKAFSRMPQRVLWKWENESLPEQPPNVMIQKWMPQFDILCHPNVKAYISHGGLLGTTEAVHCGVPMVVMPQYGDQFVNAAALQASGGGVILDFKEATEETIYNALQTVLAPSFNQKAKELSSRFKDRPMPPLATAVYWVEYVARHKGAHHMRTKAVGMPWYQYLLLDVIAFLLLVFLTTMAAIFYCLRTIFRITCGKSHKVKTN